MNVRHAAFQAFQSDAVGTTVSIIGTREGEREAVAGLACGGCTLSLFAFFGLDATSGQSPQSVKQRT